MYLKEHNIKELINICNTWEDIRVYLLSKGYIVKITPYITRDVSEYEVIILDINNLTDDFKGRFSPNPIFLDKDVYPTYEEARIEGIKWCLKLIELNEQS